MARRVYAPTAGAGCTIWPARRPPSGEDGGTSNRAGERRETSLPGRATTSVANGGLATLPTLDLLLRIAQDATATPVERLKAASEAARFLLPKKPGPKKSRRGKFPPDEYGFSVDPNLARELRDAKLQLACLRLSSRKLTPCAVAQKASKLQARIKEIQESLQCPRPSKYRLTYSLGASPFGPAILVTHDPTETCKNRGDTLRRCPALHHGDFLG